MRVCSDKLEGGKTKAGTPLGACFCTVSNGQGHLTNQANKRQGVSLLVESGTAAYQNCHGHSYLRPHPFIAALKPVIYTIQKVNPQDFQPSSFKAPGPSFPSVLQQSAARMCQRSRGLAPWPVSYVESSAPSRLSNKQPIIAIGTGVPVGCKQENDI